MDARRLPGLLCALLAPSASLADPGPGQTVLTDHDLVAYAARPYDHAAMMNQHVRLGRHHGVTVVADFPCSDVCPDYTTRIIHYDAPPGPACKAAGGVTQLRQVPFSIATREEAFCVPKVLAGDG